MENKIEQMEQKLLRWEKWLYACFGSAIIMLAQAFIKASENFMLTDFLSSIEEKVVVPANIPDHYVYVQTAYNFLLSPERYWLWLIVELAALTPAAILVFHPAWRKIALAKRLDLIFGYLLAGWVTLLSLGAQNSLNAPNGYNTLVVVYLLALGLGYWQLRKRQARTEEVFP